MPRGKAVHVDVCGVCKEPSTGVRGSRGFLWCFDSDEGSDKPDGWYHQHCHDRVVEPDCTKLPKRYRLYISRLLGELHELRRLKESEEETDVWIGGMSDREKRYLPRRAKVTFVLPPPFGAPIQVSLDDRTGSLQIYGERALVIVPEVSNVVLMRNGK